MKGAKTVGAYIESQEQWSDLLKSVRTLFLELGLEETIKWGIPVYVLDKKNVVGLAGFKAFASIWFYQGALLGDPDKCLVNAQEGVTRAQRQMRFSSSDQLDLQQVRIYTLEAMENMKRGLEIKPRVSKPLAIPPELSTLFATDSNLESAFDKLNLTKRREFADHISSAKKPETRLTRLEKIIPMILDGVGLSDKYRS